jgi:hypothetical protein
MTDETDKELFLAVKAKDPVALEILYDRYVGLVYKLALRILTRGNIVTKRSPIYAFSYFLA